jgi:hypothetical protein
VSEFAKQVSNRVYESMIFEIAKEALNTKNDSFELVGENSQAGDESNVAHDEETNARNEERYDDLRAEAL